GDRHHRGQRARQRLRDRAIRAGQTAAVSTSASARSGRLATVLQRCALVLLLLVVWWAASLATPVYVLPSPQRVFARVVQLTQSGDLPVNRLTPLLGVLAGFAIAVLLGVPGGLLLASNRAPGNFFEPILPVMNTVSSAIWAIFAVIWFGLSPATPIFV